MEKNNYTVVVYPLAEEDLDNIYNYYFEQSQETEMPEN